MSDFEKLILTADAKASHYGSALKPNYTVWAEYGENCLHAGGGKSEKAQKIQIDRFTKIEYDPVADAITATLDTNKIAYEKHTDHENDTGYIHHIWDCEVI